MTEREQLREAIRRLHNLKCTHVRSEHVLETFQRQVVWDGAVEIFSCTDDPSVLVYAWSYETDEGNRRYVTVLGKPPIKSARDAVRAHIVADRKIGQSVIR